MNEKLNQKWNPKKCEPECDQIWPDWSENESLWWKRLSGSEWMDIPPEYESIRV